MSTYERVIDREENEDPKGDHDWYYCDAFVHSDLHGLSEA